MTRNSKFFLIVKVLVGVIGSLNLGISTSFLLGKGLSFLELSVVYSLILGTSLILEFPSGNLADRHGRKLIYSIGLLAIGTQFMFYAFFSNVILLYVAAILAGVGDAFISGSLEAWLAQSESKVNKKDDFCKVFGLRSSLASFFSIIVSIFIGTSSGINITYIYVTAGFILFLISMFTILFLQDNRGASNRTLDYTYQTVIEFIKSPTLLLLAFILSSAFACYSIFILYWQPMATLFNIPLHRLLLLHSANLFGAAISSYIFSKYARKFGLHRFLIISFILLGFSFSMVLFINNLYTLIISLFIFGLGYGAIIPLFFSWATNTISTYNAASMLSLMSSLASLTAIITTIIIGAVIDNIGLEASLLIGLFISVFIIICVNAFTKLFHNKKLSLTEGTENENSIN
jgi:MFS family permease